MATNRIKGTAAFAVNFEPGGQSPLDARLLVSNIADLTDADTYAAKNVYNGMTVTVLKDNNNLPALYVLTNKDKVTNIDSWLRIDSNNPTVSSASKVTMTTIDGSDGVLKTYKFVQNGVTVGTIDIPKDIFLKEGSVVKGTFEGTSFTESASGLDTAIKLVITNGSGSGTDSTIYVNAKDLVKDASGTNAIVVDQSTGKNVISLKLDTTGDAKYISQSNSGLKLNGISADINAAKAEVSAKTINGHALSTQPVLNGGDIKLSTNPTAGATGNQTITTSDTLNSVIDKLVKNDNTNLTDLTNKINQEISDRKNAITSANTNGVHHYVKQVTTGTSVSILGSTHNCGKFPIVQTYLGNDIVECTVSVNHTTGDITVTWSGVTLSSSNIMYIDILGSTATSAA